MQYKRNVKIIIDKRKLDILLRLNCPKDILFDAIVNNKIIKTNDELIDENLESLIDIKEFNNWGGKRNNSGRKNHLENQVENHLENQEHNQVVDIDKDIDKDINNNNNIPSKKEILDYVSSLCKKIDADSFIAYYQASNWCDKDGLPINWKQKAITWANKYVEPEVDDVDRKGEIIRKLEEKARKAGKI